MGKDKRCFQVSTKGAEDERQGIGVKGKGERRTVGDEVSPSVGEEEETLSVGEEDERLIVCKEVISASTRRARTRRRALMRRACTRGSAGRQ